MSTGVGVLGLGTFLPPHVRTNDWWPESAVARWREKPAHRATQGQAAAPAEMSAGAQVTLAAMAEYADDPFRGARERRVMADDMTVHDMEAAAAREAIERAGVSLDQIDVILTQTPVPEHLMVNGACATHRLLGLPQRCVSMGTEGACNAFPMHATLARALIASGAARHVLSVHSSAITRVHGTADPQSAWWGDGAAAAVFGAVSDGKGILAAVHNTDGSGCEALALGTPDGRWWGGGHALTTYHVDRSQTVRMLLTIVDRARDAIHQALATAGHVPADVAYYVSHQGTAWLTRATAGHAGLSGAATTVTFPSLGNMNSANLPYLLAAGERDGKLHDGDLVATFSGGLGETWSSLVMRWGR